MRLLFLFLCCLLPGLAVAQARSVLSGEHGEFTRLSVPIPLGADWRLEDGFEGYSLVVDGAYWKSGCAPWPWPNARQPSA